MSTNFETVVTQEGDTVDSICFDRFGTHGSETAILAMNPGLAALGPFIPIGTVVKIPIPELKDRVELQDIWS